MSLYTCERCGKRTAKRIQCNYCKKKICDDCLKSSKRAHGHDIIHICKDCWTKLETRRQFKSATRKI